MPAGADAIRATLARGLAILDDETTGLGKGGKLSGETAFKLYDTYGFPLDLTEDALRPRGIAVDKEGFVDMDTDNMAQDEVGGNLNTV